MKRLRVYQEVISVGFILTLFFVPAFGAVPISGATGSVAPVSAAAPSDGFSLSGRHIIDANGTIFIMRGVNHPHTWFLDETTSLAHIKAKRGNTVRVVLSTGQRQGWTKNSASDVADVISLCKAHRLVCVLEIHDTTGYGEEDGAITLAEAVAYWKEIQSVLTGQEAYVIINLGNEPWGNVNALQWVNATRNAIVEMRNAGFTHMLMVDAPNWGQDHEFIMRDHAASILANDPLGNTVFSVHMYGQYEVAASIESYILSFVNAGLPLVIGEFGPLHIDGDPDEDAILRLAEKYRIGYLGWSWSGNCCGGEVLDMVVNFNPNQMTDWGNRIFEGSNGIIQTSCEASIYGHHCFEDVAVGYWAWNHIERLYQAKITTGCAANPRQYCPESTVTRDQMAVFLLKARHSPSYNPPAVGGNTGFIDVPPGYWAAGWIKQLAAEGITGGCGEGNYCPGAAVTRDQMAVFLLKAKYGKSYIPPAVDGSTGFTDVPPGHWAAAWIKQLAAEGITGGCGAGIYCPGQPVNRDQMAVFLVKTFNLP